MHELATYHRVNPDPDRPGLCNNTGEVIDGVVFPGITPMDGSICFVGRTSLHEAVAELHNMTVAEVQDRLAAEGAKNLQEIKRLKAEIKRLNADVSKFTAFADALERAGFIAPALS